ncbi:MAG: type II toxin-antitoxin system RelE/ParE family toxin [Thermodesulfobacteriota bacterium]|nr:type II toxin-antitoxin system RelE/ParE family toxin [Thermodesulfobacteriota bacterium]
MKVKDVLILKEASDDLNEGKAFYDIQEPEIGDYFWDCMISDIESLIIYAGIHRKQLGLYKMFARRFPYALYYDIIEDVAYVVAVLPMRRDPAWILKQLRSR